MLKTTLGVIGLVVGLLSAAPTTAQTMFRPVAVVNDSAITGTGTPASMAYSTVHRPSPESWTMPCISVRSGSFSNADWISSSSQDRISHEQPEQVNALIRDFLK